MDNLISINKRVAKLEKIMMNEIEIVDELPFKATAELFQGKDEQWYLRLVGSNGENLMTSEGHKNKGDLEDLWEKYFRSTFDIEYVGI